MNKFALAVVVVAALSLVMLPGCPGKNNSGAAGGPNVGVVDMDHVLRETGMAETIRANLNRAREQAQLSLQKTRQVLLTRAQELNSKLEPMVKKMQEDARANTPTTLPEEGVKLRNQIAAMDVIFQGATQAKNQQMQQYVEEIQTKFRLDIQPALQDLGKSKSVSVVMAKPATLYVDPSNNLTDVLISRLKEKPLPAVKDVPADMSKEVDISQALKQIGLEP